MPTEQKKLEKKLNANLSNLLAKDSSVFSKGRFFTSSQFLLDTWKNKKRNWGHSMHGMASRSGSFPNCSHILKYVSNGN